MDTVTNSMTSTSTTATTKLALNSFLRRQGSSVLPATFLSSNIDNAHNFTCVKTIQAYVRIEPGTLKLGSGGTFTAFVTLPHQGDWRLTAAVFEGAPAVKLTRHGHNYKATFNKQDLKGITVGDAVTFTVTLFGEQRGHHCGHSDKDEIAFEGSDTVRVVE